MSLFLGQFADLRVPRHLQGKELLSPGRNANYNEDHKIVTPTQVTLFCYVHMLHCSSVSTLLNQAALQLHVMPMHNCSSQHVLQQTC